MDTQRRALVTGATGGIGRGFAIALASEGWAVTATARDGDALAKLVQELPGSGHEALPADLGDEIGVEVVTKRIAAVHHDVLINNAGFGLYGEFTKIPIAKQRAMVRLNCEALMTLSHAFIDASRAGDTLLNTASTLGFTPFPSGGAYAATKAFVVSLSESLCYEQRKRGVNVIGLCPGATRTPFHSSAGAAEASPFPSFMFQDVDGVVRTGMRAIRGRRGGSRVSGLLNASLVWFGRVLPRSWMVRMMGQFAPRTVAS